LKHCGSNKLSVRKERKTRKFSGIVSQKFSGVIPNAVRVAFQQPQAGQSAFALASSDKHGFGSGVPVGCFSTKIHS
jgi:hypothetical protein